MKKTLFTIVMSLLSVAAFADWTYGTAQFKGNPPSNCTSIGGVLVYYNGSLTCKSSYGNVDYYEGTGDICVIFPRNYTGKKMTFTSSGGSVQIQYLK